MSTRKETLEWQAEARAAALELARREQGVIFPEVIAAVGPAPQYMKAGELHERVMGGKGIVQIDQQRTTSGGHRLFHVYKIVEEAVLTPVDTDEGSTDNGTGEDNSHREPLHDLDPEPELTEDDLEEADSAPEVKAPKRRKSRKAGGKE